MATERNSKVVEDEMETLKEKIRGLEAKRAAHAKAIEGARATRKAGAFKAHADGDSKAAATLATARESELRAAMEMQDIESAIAEGRAMFDSLEREWKAAVDSEAWSALLAEAELAKKEEAEIDKHAAALVRLLAAHGERLKRLKNTAYNLGSELAFRNVGLRHFERVFSWLLIQGGVETDREKPSEQYRSAASYAEILNQQIASAVLARDKALKEREAGPWLLPPLTVAASPARSFLARQRSETFSDAGPLLLRVHDG